MLERRPDSIDALFDDFRRTETGRAMEIVASQRDCIPIERIHAQVLGGMPIEEGDRSHLDDCPRCQRAWYKISTRSAPPQPILKVILFRLKLATASLAMSVAVMLPFTGYQVAEKNAARHEVAIWREKAASLEHEIETSRVREAIDVEDFSASGQSTIRVKGSYDPHFIETVDWLIKDKKQSLDTSGVGSRVAFVGAVEVPLDGEDFESVLSFTVKEGAPSEFFTPERTVRKRMFRAGLDGVITDPSRAPEVASLDYFLHTGDSKSNMYLLGGRVSDKVVGIPGWIIAYARNSSTFFVLDELFVEPGPSKKFSATCRLGMDRIDGEEFQLFVAFSDDPEKKLSTVNHMPGSFNWKAYHVSEIKRKINDGTDGFVPAPEAGRVQPK